VVADIDLEISGKIILLFRSSLSKWQNMWIVDSCSHEHFYRIIEYNVSLQIVFDGKNRKKQFTISKPRLGK